MNPFKNKIYWLILIPYALIGIMVIAFTNQDRSNLYIAVMIIGFWIIYYLLTYMDKKVKQKRDV